MELIKDLPYFCVDQFSTTVTWPVDLQSRCTLLFFALKHWQSAISPLLSYHPKMSEWKWVHKTANQMQYSKLHNYCMSQRSQPHCKSNHQIPPPPPPPAETQYRSKRRQIGTATTWMAKTTVINVRRPGIIADPPRSRPTWPSRQWRHWRQIMFILTYKNLRNIQ